MWPFRRPSVLDDLHQDIRDHLAEEIQDNIDRGMSPEQARHTALRRFGNVTRVTEDTHAVWMPIWIDQCVQDVRYAIRSVRKHPAFTAVAVTMLAVGIGVNATVFTVMNAVLFKGSRSIDRNDRILYVGSGAPCCVSYPDFEDWRARAKSFEGMGAVADLRITLSDEGGLSDASGATEVSANTFTLIGQKPMLGRNFSVTDETPGAAPVAILGYRFWERRYNKSPAVIGQTVRINGVSTTVIGVMAHDVSFPQQQDLWVPLVPTPNLRRRDARGLWFAFGRLADGRTPESARAEMDTIGRRLAAQYPGTNQGFLPVVMNFHQFYFGPNASTIYQALWAAVGFVLLIACANLAHLTLARAVGRSNEMSIRMALGAGRSRIIRQLLIESLVLSAMGGVIGWWIAEWGVRAYELAANPPTLYWSEHLLDYSLDSRVLAYLVAISIGTAVVFGMMPALRLSRVDVHARLKDGGRGAIGGRRARQFSALLVGGEMALAVVLLAGAGVMIRSFLNVYTADVGVKPGNVLTFLVTLPDIKYPAVDAQTAFFDRLVTQLEALPGVESVATAWRPPTSGAVRLQYEMAGAPTVDAQRRPTISTMVVSPAYFQTLGAAVLSGRDFNDADGRSGSPVAIVNQQFARTQWPGEDPLGNRIRFFDAETPDAWLTVVGVASNIVQNATRQEVDPLVYVPYRQRPMANMWVFARTNVPPGSLATAVRREFQTLDSDLPMWLGPFPLSERLAAIYWTRGLYGVLFLIFATVALLLASVGVYAIMAHSVSQRSLEIGIRTALGATARDILALVFRQGMLPVGTGLAIGLIAALAAMPVLKSQLVNVSPTDPLTFFVAVAVLIVSAGLGCWIPARRAVRIDPAIALRNE